MARHINPWVGKTDDQMPPPDVTARNFAKAKGCCENCLRKLMAGEKWARDHILPLKDGGINIETNLQILCEPCHGQKTSGENSLRAAIKRKTKAVYGIQSAPIRPIQSRGFAKAVKLKLASSKSLPPVRLYALKQDDDA